MTRLKNNHQTSLQNNSVVVIVGGGPSGCGCALSLLKIASERGISLNVIIIEGKIFKRSKHYNQCAGVLSPPIVELLDEELNIEFPHELTQRIIKGYILYGHRKSARLSGSDSISYALHRVNFDEYMLKEAENRGAEVIQARVTDVEIHSSYVRVYHESGNIKADVVVGAFGLDAGACRIFERDTNYRHPPYLDSIVTTIHPGLDFMQNYENCIHAFLPPLKGIEFGAVTPKLNHLTVNIAGSHIGAKQMDAFLSSDAVMKVLPPTNLWNRNSLDFYKGRFPVGISKGLFSDRFVAVGDAAGMVRPFKGKGVNSGIVTGVRAAKVMMEYGVSTEDFKIYYRMCSDIVEDLPLGKILRFLTNRLANLKLIDPVLNLAETNKDVNKVLFDCVSAHQSFRNIYRYMRRNRTISRIALSLLNPRTMLRMLQS